MLLGCDVLKRSNLTWRPQERIMLWGGTAYDVAHVRSTRAGVQGVVFPDSHRRPENSIHLGSMVQLEPHKVAIIKVKVNEPQGSWLLVYPRNKYTLHSCVTLVEVDETQHIPVAIDNPAKVRRIIKAGTTLATYDPYSGEVEQSFPQVCQNKIKKRVNLMC